MNLLLLFWDYLEVVLLGSRIEIPSVWEGLVWSLHCRSKDISLRGSAARKLVFPMDPNLCRNFTLPCHSWLHKTHPWCTLQSGELLWANWELWIFSLSPTPACQEGFLQCSTGICSDAEQLVWLGCLEKRMFGADLQQFLTGEVMSSKIWPFLSLYHPQGLSISFG